MFGERLLLSPSHARFGSRLCENAQPIAQFVMGLFVARRACVIPSSTPIQHWSALLAPPMALLGRFGGS
jgi:hypothetical protein